MALRTQKIGKQKRWSLKDIQNGLEEFHKESGRYPTSQEFDTYPHLPSSRQIQRRFGGLVALRNELGLLGQKDFTRGAHSKKRARAINKRSHLIEQEVYGYLIERFGVEFVHREHFFTDDKRTRSDFLVYHKDGAFSVDVFHPANRHNLIGCLNTKLRKYKDDLMLQYPVIFLQMNSDISEKETNGVVSRKKRRLKKYQRLMGYNSFKKFCEEKTPRG